MHLRCGFFMTNLLTDLDGPRAGRLTTIRPLDDPMRWLDPRDIAAAATGRLLAGEGFIPEQPRSVLTTTPGSLAGWAITELRPALQPAS